MHKIMKLKDRLLEELEEYADKPSISMDDLTCIKYLSSATDHLCNVVKDSDEGSYRGMSRAAYRDPLRYAYDDGGVEPGRSGRMSSRGYSRSGDMAEKLREVMRQAPDEHARSEIQKLIDKLDHV